MRSFFSCSACGGKDSHELLFNLLAMSAKLTPSPLSSLRISRYFIPAYGFIPNTSIQNRPLSIYYSAFPPSSTLTTASTIESYLSSIPNGVRPAWRYSMYSTDHFHSTSHEVLSIASGSAKCSFGHLDNPDHVEEVLKKGDVVILPAGVCHRLMEELEKPFLMVGSYPEGCDWDLCYGKQGEEGKIKAIETLDWFRTDPIYGDHGPALE